MKHFTKFLMAAAVVTIISCNSKKEEENPEPAITEEQNTVAADTVTEAPAPKIERPEKSTAETTLNTSLLFNTWVSNPDSPHADFKLSKKSFYVVDYDGDGDMPYILKDKKLTIFYKDFVQEAEIISLTKDKLVLLWKGVEEPTNYVVWKG